MPGVPAFILRRLYVKGSLENTAEGWHFKLKNSLGSGHARGMQPLQVDGKEIPMEQTTFQQDGRDIPFSEVSESNTFGLQMNREIEITVHNEPLTDGAHKVWMGFIVPGFGKLGFDFTDEVKVA